MPPTVLDAPYRIGFYYTVGNLQHRCGHYLRCVGSGDASGFDTVGRPGYGNYGLTGIVAQWAAIWAPFYDDANTSFDYALLERNDGGEWVYVWSVAIATQPTGTGSYAPASGICFSGKSTDNQNFPVYMYEQFFPGFIKVSSYAALSANNQTVASQYFNAGGTPDDASPVAWRVSRGNFYSQRWIAMVADSNQKLRRIRGIA